jgi:small-conductance mechanosensitive channel
VGTLEGVLQEIRNQQHRHQASVERTLEAILAAVESGAASSEAGAVALRLLSEKVGRIVNDLDTLAAAFTGYAQDVDAKLAEVLAEIGQVGPEAQAKINALQDAIRAADDHLATVGQPPAIGTDTTDTSADGSVDGTVTDLPVADGSAGDSGAADQPA